jgi:hypothetical protein
MPNAQPSPVGATDCLIGYSALDLLEECYEYDENACHVSDSPESLKRYLRHAGFSLAGYQIRAIRFSDFLKDFAGSRGQYGLEPQALSRFEQAAKAHGLHYEVEEYKDEEVTIEPRLFVVSFSGWRRNATKKRNGMTTLTCREQNNAGAHHTPHCHPSRKTAKPFGRPR